MADVLNLNRFRKRKKREADKRDADRNAVVHGRPRAEREELRAEQALEHARLDGQRRERPPAAEGEDVAETRPEPPDDGTDGSR